MAKNKHAAALGRRNKGKPKTTTEAANEARRRNWATGRDRLRVLREARKKLEQPNAGSHRQEETHE